MANVCVEKCLIFENNVFRVGDIVKLRYRGCYESIKGRIDYLSNDVNIIRIDNSKEYNRSYVEIDINKVYDVEKIKKEGN